MTTLTVTATMLSDWHIGSGQGRGKNIDRALVRDAAGAPCLPAKSVIGVLRGRAEQIAAALDATEAANPWADWVDWLFGSRPTREGKDTGHARRRPVPAALVAAPLRLTTATDADAVAAHLGITAAEFVAATTVVRAGVTINESGVAVPDQFRSEERARSGLVLSADWTVGSARTEDALWPAALLLRGAAKLTEAIGGKRRRGAGRVALAIEGSGPWKQDLGELVQRAEATPPETPSPNTSPSAPRGTLTGAPRHALTVFITARSPLLVGATTRGNEVTSATTIPGAMLLPIVHRGLSLPPEAVRDGKVIVTDATPVADGHRAIPWPQVLTRTKGSDTGEVTNTSRKHRFDPKLKPVSAYLAPTPGGPVETRVDTVQRMHVSIEQKDGANDTELFSYEAIAAGTVLAAEVWLADGAEYRIGDLPTEARLGRSRKDDYGHVGLEWRAAEPKTSRPAIAAEEDITVLLESDVLLRSTSGAPAPSAAALIAELRAVLAVGLSEVRPEVGAGSTRQTVAVTATRVESWQTRWQLPRPSLIGLAAGSVLLLRADGAIDGAALALLDAGIGERTAEGFGRISINPTALREEKLVVSRAAPTRNGGDAPRLPDSTVDLLRESALMARIDRRIGHLRTDDDERAKWIPPNVGDAQLGVLRGLALGLTAPSGFANFREWADGAEAIERRKSFWKDQIDDLRALVAAANPERRSPDATWVLLGDATGGISKLAGLLPLDIQFRCALRAVQSLLVELTSVKEVRDDRDL